MTENPGKGAILCLEPIATIALHPVHSNQWRHSRVHPTVYGGHIPEGTWIGRYERNLTIRWSSVSTSEMKDKAFRIFNHVDSPYL